MFGDDTNDVKNEILLLTESFKGWNRLKMKYAPLLKHIKLVINKYTLDPKV